MNRFSGCSTPARLIALAGLVVPLSLNVPSPAWAQPPATAQTPPAAQTPYGAAGPIPEPVVFGEGVISTGEYESHPGFTPDGRTLYFVRSTPEFTDWKIFVTEYADGKWSTPKMAPFSGSHRDADPFVTADGQKLYFISDRPVDGESKEDPKDDMDIWVIEKTKEGGWGEPKNLAAPVNSPASEWFPTVAASGTIYFGSGRDGGQGLTDLYRARQAGGKFTEAENLGTVINSPAEEYEDCIAPDESFLVFMAAGRPGGTGGGDLLISEQEQGKWSAPKNLGPKINGKGLEISPCISPDGKYFFFSSARKVGEFAAGERPNRSGNGLGDIYQMDLEALRALAK
jgi:Tol biopolymer transport system component